MPATESTREVATRSPERMPAPIAEMVGRAEWPRPCARSGICRSLLCQTNRTNMSCPRQLKGN
jgi:hypothetical protein